MDRKFCKNIIDSSKEAFLYKKKGEKKRVHVSLRNQIYMYG